MSKLPHNRTWYTKKLSAIAKKVAKERDGYVCQKCGKDCQGSDAHGSHVMNVGAHKNLELDPENIKCLCSYCHLRWWHKDVREAARWFNEKFPERAEYLDMAIKEKWKIPTVELAGLYEKVKGDYSKYAVEYYEVIKNL